MRAATHTKCATCACFLSTENRTVKCARLSGQKRRFSAVWLDVATCRANTLVPFRTSLEKIRNKKLETPWSRRRRRSRLRLRLRGDDEISQGQRTVSTDPPLPQSPPQPKKKALVQPPPPGHSRYQEHVSGIPPSGSAPRRSQKPSGSEQRRSKMGSEPKPSGSKPGSSPPPSMPKTRLDPKSSASKTPAPKQTDVPIPSKEHFDAPPAKPDPKQRELYIHPTTGHIATRVTIKREPETEEAYHIPLKKKNVGTNSSPLLPSPPSPQP